HTRWPRDWSSNVCSSDLCAVEPRRRAGGLHDRGDRLKESLILADDDKLTQNLFDGCDGGVELPIVGVEMRRHADAGLRAIVDEDVALQQLATDVVRLRHVDRYRAAALFRIARCVDAPVVPIGQLDQPRGLT